MIYTFKLPDGSDKTWFFKPAVKFNYFVWKESIRCLYCYYEVAEPFSSPGYSLAKPEELVELIRRIWQAKQKVLINR